MAQSTVVYRMPNETDFYSLTSHSPLLLNEFNDTENFYFSNFDSALIYSFNNPIANINAWPNFIPHLKKSPDPTNKKDYLKKVAELTQLIQAGDYTKVVFSRIKHVKKSTDFKLKQVFLDLCKQHPSAFVYCLSTEETGTWIGATPELLLDKKGSQYKTVSLAGTRVEGIEWTSKEIHEQEVVTEYITDKIKAFTSDLKVSQPFDLKAGSVFHLKSELTFTLENQNKRWELVNQLNPTPAVCGIPTEKAKLFIREKESHDRALYTGFIGHSQSSLFVNLRCMQVCTDNLALYLGGGIMGDSVPENEWEETENKAKTLLSVL